jgi:hypothetical protein
MDGPMSKTVLISLAAVVALIVIVVLLGMRYLRADDEDEFGDEMASDQDHSGGRGGHLGRDHHTRLRSHHDNDLEDPRRARDSNRVGSGRSGSGRSGSGRSDSGRSDAGHRERGPDPRGAVRADQDRRWREDSGEISRAGRAPQRDLHLVKTGEGGRRDYADIGEPVAARGRPGRSQPGRVGRGGLDDFDSQPTMVSSSRAYDRDAIERHERRDAGDRFGGQEDPGYADPAGRRDDRDRLGRDGREGRDSRMDRETRRGREIRDTRDGRQSRDNRDVGEAREPRPAASLREDDERDQRDRRGATRPNGRPDARRNGAKPDREALPAVRPRQGKNKRDSEGDWPTTEWDELSDVDYWAELASDKPLTTAVPAGEASRSQRREPRQEARQGQDARTGQDSRARERQDADSRVEPVKQANRQERQPERATASAAPRTPSVTGSDRMTGNPVAANPVAANGRAARPIAADDDPLTSPSFPRITTEDSRSYRRTRTAAGDYRDSASHSGPMPAIGSDYYGAPVGYPKPPIDHAGPGYTNSAPASYQMPAAASAAFHPGNAGFSDLQGPAASHSLPAGAARSYPAADSLSYSTPGPESVGYSLPGGMSAAGYLPSAPPTADSYGGDTGAGNTYPGPESAGFRPEVGHFGQHGQPGQHGQVGYEHSLPHAGGYRTTGSYSVPAQSTYDVRHTDQPGGYQGAGSALGSPQGPEVGYRAEGYPNGSGQAAQGPVHGNHVDPGYPPAYPGPMPGDHTVPYQSPAAQPPGYPEYGPGGNEPASIAAQAPEGPGYTGGDPYPADPYGFPGYGGTRY